MIHCARSLCIANVKKSNLRYTRAFTPKRTTSGGAHLRRLALGQHSKYRNSDESLARMFDMTELESESKTAAPVVMSLITALTDRYDANVLDIVCCFCE